VLSSSEAKNLIYLKWPLLFLTNEFSSYPSNCFGKLRRGSSEQLKLCKMSFFEFHVHKILMSIGKKKTSERDFYLIKSWLFICSLFNLLFHADMFHLLWLVSGEYPLFFWWMYDNPTTNEIGASSSQLVCLQTFCDDLTYLCTVLQLPACRFVNLINTTLLSYVKQFLGSDLIYFIVANNCPLHFDPKNDSCAVWFITV
jgi:hypothetical protein